MPWPWQSSCCVPTEPAPLSRFGLQSFLHGVAVVASISAVTARTTEAAIATEHKIRRQSEAGEGDMVAVGQYNLAPATGAATCTGGPSFTHAFFLSVYDENGRLWRFFFCRLKGAPRNPR